MQTVAGRPGEDLLCGAARPSSLVARRCHELRCDINLGGIVPHIGHIGPPRAGSDRNHRSLRFLAQCRAETPNKLPAAPREQLGLQLDAVTAPISVIVVDDVQQPVLDVESAAESSADVQAGSEHRAVRTILFENAKGMARDVAGDLTKDAR